MFARNHLLQGVDAVFPAVRAWAGRNGVRLGRVFWLALLIVHSPAFLKLWRAAYGSQASEASIVGCAWLSAAMLFFVLKAFGVSWLRFRTDRRSRLAIAIAILLIHAGPLGVAPDGILAPGNMPLLGTLFLAANLDRLHQWGRGTLGLRPRPALGQSWQWCWPARVILVAPSLSPLIVRAPRPPPHLR
jgi:hypothetical protein